MEPLTEKLSYKNTNGQIKKLLKISWGIPKNKWIEHKFDIESGIFGIARQKIAIQLQNILNCIKFLIKYLDFQHNQTYKPCHVYNQNKN